MEDHEIVRYPMSEKYDLTELLDEIKEDETGTEMKKTGPVSQEQIKELMLKRLKNAGKDNA